MINTGWNGLRVLVLSPTPTHPLNFGNRKRIHVVCSELKRRGAEIHYIHYASEIDWRSNLPIESARYMAHEWDSYWTVAPTRQLHAEPTGSHHTLDEWWDPAIGDTLRWLFSLQNFDVMIVNYTWLSKAFEYAPAGVFRVLDTHDRFSGRRELFEDHGLEPEFFYMQEDEERKALSRADVVWAIKEQEAAFFESLTRGHVLTLPHAEDIKVIGRVSTDRRILRFGIVGARNNINVANIKSFLSAALAYVERNLLPFEIHVAGSCCDDLNKETYPPFIKLRGKFQDLGVFYAEMDVMLAPMTFSTGLKIKVGEALSFGKALIAHRHAYEGYPQTHAFQVLDSFDAMLVACRDVVRRPELVGELELASLGAAAATSRQVTLTLNTTAAVREKLTPGVCICISLADVTTGNLRLDHACEVAKYLSWLAPVHIVLRGPTPAEIDHEALERLVQFGSIAIAPSLAPLAAQLGPILRQGRLRQRSLLELSQEGHAAVWFASPPLPEDRLPSASSMVVYLHAAAMLAGGETESLLDLLRRLSVSFAQVALLATHDEPLTCAARAISGVDFLRVPLLFNGHQALSLWALTRAERAGIVVLADTRDDPLAHLALDTLRVLGCKMLHLVVSNNQSSNDGHLVTLDPNQFIQRVWRSRSAPSLIVDTSVNSALGALREVLNRSGIPYVSVFCDRAKTSNRSDDFLVASGLFGSIEYLQQLINSKTYAQDVLPQRIGPLDLLGDPGWTIIWGRVRDQFNKNRSHP